MLKRDFVNQVIDYVETSQDAIAELQKEAATASAKPAFSDDVLEQTAEKLVSSGLLTKEASDDLVQSFRETPEEALLSLQKLAGVFKRENAVTTLGGPAKIQKKAASEADSSEPKADSDKAWESSFRDGANS